MEKGIEFRPSLMELCLIQVAENLCEFADQLPLLPLEIANALIKKIQEKRSSPYLHELAILCEAFWRPTTLSLCGIPGLTSHGLQYLSYTASSLTKLDLRGCTGLDSLVFLPVLVQLECLNLRDCWRLPGDCLSYIQRMSALRALNLSGTGVGDGFLEAVSYGHRLQRWITEHSCSSSDMAKQCYRFQASSGDTDSTMRINDDDLHQWPTIELIYLRLQRTKISEASVPYIRSLKQIVLLDVRNTGIMGKSLRSLQAIHRLVSLPNNSKLLAYSNSQLNATLRGACGCSSMETGSSSNSEMLEKKCSWVQWEQDGIVTLLKKASRLRMASSFPCSS